MNSLERQHLIKKEKLNQTYYFQSILQKAYGLKLLTDSELENIQMQSLQLLSKRIERYTDGESSSVKVETAESIMQSIFYCVGSYLKSFPDIDMSIEVLKQKPLLELYLNGKKTIDLQLECAKELLCEIQNDSVVTDNYAYNDTIQNGLQVFFTSYDVDFAAHDTPASIDYPLSNDNMELVGIDYIDSYLKKLSLENKFCKNFTEHDIHCLLRGYDENYKDLLINIFGLVLTNLVGSLLANKTTLQLKIEPSDRVFLQQKLGGLSKDKLDTMLQCAARRLCTELNISERILQKHIAATVMELSERVKNALENNRLESIFISLKENCAEQSFQFEDGVKMNDESFRNIADEVRTCRYVSDKIAIIKREIHSIIDLIDILEGHCILDDEFSEIFQSLGDMELALLLKNLPTYIVDSNYQFTENEKEWKNKLNCFFKEIDLVRVESIRELSKKINCN
ncbi:DUF6179 domain-containing protein [Clostridium estertheticum]|uniref:DUF6179 domain-containing protein n=1 Tax=Clostridium estertheticum TaxID=238834 RepID=UPI0013E922E8|nr:DUF6179 domain-containing protein [Clostridium estertheticum]MBZ9686651.1 DUF6179 domain-containing protein [Clostridium estertheticum]